VFIYSSESVTKRNEILLEETREETPPKEKLTPLKFQVHSFT